MTNDMTPEEALKTLVEEINTKMGALLGGVHNERIQGQFEAYGQVLDRMIDLGLTQPPEVD